MRHVYTVMASVQNIGNNGEKIKVENDQTSQSTGMSKEISHVPVNKAPLKESYWFAHSGIEDVTPGGTLSDPKAAGNLKDLQLQKDKEEKIRLFREQQEEERMRKLRDLESQFLQAKKHREQQEEERRRRIEEARIKETERRQQVEERKRQIWEAEQERKEAILRRNMEREARIEARRNAQRNSQCFAFGSSTPRSFDLDLAAIGVGSQGSVLMSSVSRRSEERELGPPRATSACSLDRKFENVSYDDNLRYDRYDFFRSSSLEPMPSSVNYLSKQIAMQHKSSNDMKACLSMWDNNVTSRPNFFDNPSCGWLVGSGVIVGEDCMSRSMVSLSSSTFRGRKRTDISPTLTRERSITPHVTPRGKDSSRSPSRPQSSLSGTSEISAASSSISAVNMRPRPAPRRPRPYSVAGSIVDSSVLTQSVRKEPERQPRLHERNGSAPVHKPHRAKSANRDSSEIKNARPLTAPKKPVPPPKSSELLAKAKPHPVPIKDNLRKMAKTPANKSLSGDSKPSVDTKEKAAIIQNGIDKIECKRKADEETKDSMPISEPKPSSTVTSPMTDSEVLLSSDDSKISAVVGSDIDTLSQSVTESELKAEDSNIASPSQSLSVSQENVNNMEKSVQEELVHQNIPKEAPEKEEKTEISSQMQSSVVLENGIKDFTPSKPRITSEEEARAALAEKRRLAREQAEREAELERQRLEEIARVEEEQRRLEELEQKRMEEEQIRLAELHRQLEQEKLTKAIEEQQQREKEEQERREEDARQKAEKEEQEKKAREEAERQRIELEEKLRKEEEERAERKRRVEQIMARTRGKSSAQSPSNSQNENNKSVKNLENTSSPIETPKTNLISQLNEVSKVECVSNGVKEPNLEKTSSINGTSENHILNSNSWPFSEEKQVLNSNPLPDLLNSANNSSNHNGRTEEQLSKISVSSSLTTVSNRTLSANEDTSPQTNGYSSHEEMSCTTSPEDNADMGLLIDIQSCQQRSSKVLSESADFTKLVEVDPPSLDNVNYLISVDDVNSNLFNSANPFVGFEDSLQKKQDTPVTDLLS